MPHWYYRRHDARRHLVVRDGIGPEGRRELACGLLVPAAETDAADAPACPECRVVLAGWIAGLGPEKS